jgi:hypothetical protein
MMHSFMKMEKKDSRFLYILALLLVVLASRDAGVWDI